MKAIVYRKNRELPVLEDLPPPIPKDGEVLVNVKAAAFNRRDYYITTGQYPGIRDGIVLGSDGAGLVDEKPVILNPGLDWGEDERAQSGRFRILGMPDNGTFAGQVCVPADHVYPKPGHLNWEEAAALPLAALTAFRALVTRAEAKAGEKLFITGIGGGVAVTVLQIGLALGMEVFVSSSSDEKIQKAIALGASGGVNYHEGDWDRQALEKFGPVDVIVDSAGGSGFNRLLKLCRPGARITVYGGTQGKIVDLSPQILFWKQISILGSTMASPRDFAAMLDFVNRHKIVPVIDEVIPMKDYERAFRLLAVSQQFGRIVLTIDA